MDSLGLPKAPRNRTSTNQLGGPTKRAEIERTAENQQLAGELVAKFGNHGGEDIDVLKEKLKFDQKLSREAKGKPPAEYVLRAIRIRPRRSTMTRHRDRHPGTIEAAAMATAAALASSARSNRYDRQRSEEQFPDNTSPISTPFPGQKHLTASPHLELAPSNSMYSYPGEYQYISKTHGNESLQIQSSSPSAPILSIDQAPTPADRERTSSSDFASPKLGSEIENMGTSTPLPRWYILQVTRIAVEELWTVEILPEILIDSSITLSQTARGLLSEIADQLTHHDRLLLCCIKWEFNPSEVIDRSWAFYLGQEGQDFSNSVRRYNAQTEEQMTIVSASSHFAQIKKSAEARLCEKYSHSMNVARAFLQLTVPLHYTDRADYVCNQVYKFCFACLKRSNFDLDCDLLRYWFAKKYGWFDVFYSIPELERMTANSGRLVTSAHFQRALRVATVVYCGLISSASQAQNQTLQSVIDCLQRLSTWEGRQDLHTEEVISPYLNDYIKNLRQQLFCRAVPNDVKHPIDRRLLLSGGSDIKPEKEEIDPALGYLKSLDNVFQQKQGPS